MIEDNLRNAYSKASLQAKEEGAKWYPAAHEYFTQLAKKYQIPFRTVLGVVSALSPFVSWQTQLDRTEAFISAELKRKGSGKFPGFGRNVNLARTLLHDLSLDPATILKGPKTLAFYHNLSGNTQEVTLDRHAISVALNRSTVDAPNSVLQAIRKAYHKVASEVGMNVRDMQAVLWIHWKMT